METGPAALVLFFGLFWGFGQGLVHPYRLFDLPDLFVNSHRKHAWRRFLVGLCVVDFAPIAYLWFLYSLVVPNRSGGLAIVSAAVSALSIFGLVSILHALVASNETCRIFYENESEYRAAAGRWMARGSNAFMAHFIPGVAYLVVFPAIGYTLGRIA